MTTASYGATSREEPPVKIQKSRIVAVLRQRHLDARADWVDRTLPAIVDVDRNAGLLATLGIDPAEAADSHP